MRSRLWRSTNGRYCWISRATDRCGRANFDYARKLLFVQEESDENAIARCCAAATYGNLGRASCAKAPLTPGPSPIAMKRGGARREVRRVFSGKARSHSSPAAMKRGGARGAGGNFFGFVAGKRSFGEVAKKVGWLSRVRTWGRSGLYCRWLRRRSEFFGVDPKKVPFTRQKSQKSRRGGGAGAGRMKAEG